MSNQNHRRNLTWDGKKHNFRAYAWSGAYAWSVENPGPGGLR